MANEQQYQTQFDNALKRLEASGKDVAILVSGNLQTYPGWKQPKYIIPEFVPLATSQGLFIHDALLQGNQGLVFYTFLSKRDALTQQDMVDLIPGYAPISPSTDAKE